MVGIPVKNPTYVYGDNQSVLANTTMPESTSKKKSNTIKFHFVREGSEIDDWRRTYTNPHINNADIITNPLPEGY